MKRLTKIIPENILATALLRYFGFIKIPLLFFVRPSVIELSDNTAVVKVPLRRRTRNHLRSMYFGALAIGADCAAGLMAMKQIQSSSQNISLIFKSVDAEFLKRAEGDVYFTCDQGRKISNLVAAAEASTERVESPVHVTAKVPDKFGEEPIARFTLVLSLKKRS
jgi:acyl-coenzyme A thioesterase PaaI-like protein